jgi:putative peptidoglycan lipid II flippase
MWPLQHAGLALASSLSAYVNVILLYWLLSQRLGPIGGRPMAGSLLRTGGASAVLLLWCVWAGSRLGGGVAGAAWTVGALGVGMLVYLGASAVLRAPELSALVGLLRRRRGQSLPGAGSG